MPHNDDELQEARDIFGETRPCIFYEGDDPAEFIAWAQENRIRYDRGDGHGFADLRAYDVPVRFLYGKDAVTWDWGT